LLARDVERNLATAQDIEESTTTLDLRLEPGLTVSGRVTDAKGKPPAKAEAEMMFWSERMGLPMGKAIRAIAASQKATFHGLVSAMPAPSR